MKNDIMERVKLPPIYQVGLVVKDIDKVKEFYSSVVGIGPWETREVIFTGMAGDQPFKYQAKLAFALSGPLTMELTEVTEGRSPVLHRFLDNNREGVHHFGFRVDSKEKDRIIADFAELGVGVVQEGLSSRGNYIAFLDTEKISGVFFELIVRG